MKNKTFRVTILLIMFRSFVFLLMTKYITACCSVKTVNFYRDPLLNGKVCAASEKSYEVSQIRSKILCTQLCDEISICTCVFYNTITKTCILCRGKSKLEQQNGTLFYFKYAMPVLDGKHFKIYVKENDEFWHYNGAGRNRIVSSLAQPDDAFVRFLFMKQEDDGSYKIESVARPTVYMYDGYNVSGSPFQTLHGRQNIDDNNMRYLVTMETVDYFRIQTKSTGRYVRLDEDQHVTSKLNIIDDRSLFKFVEA